MILVDVKKQLGSLAIETKFETPHTGVTTLFGQSGAGKTSVINMLAGLERPDTGRIVLGDRILFDSDANINVAPERRRIGYVFQEPRLFPHLNVSGNLTYGMNLIAAAQRKIKPEYVIDLLDLAHLLDRRPAKLSGGEKQRVAIGRALLTSPALMLMDEPLANLDGGRKREILPFIERLRDEMDTPIIYVSHALEEVVRLTDTLVLISKGQTIAAGPVEEITSRLDLYPHAGRYEAGAVITTHVEDHDAEYGLSHLRFAGGVLTVPGTEMPNGTRLRMRVRARDVALAKQRPEHTSVLNILPATVDELRDDGGPQVDVRLILRDETGSTALIARITRRATHQLNLSPGTTVYAMIKAIAIDNKAMGRPGPRSNTEGI